MASSSVASIAQRQRLAQDLLPNLSTCQARVLGMVSGAIVQTNGCGLTRLSRWVAELEGVPAGRVRQRMRELYYEAVAKRGKQRQEIEVEACFAPLLAGVVRGWQGAKELALALDASTVGQRFTVLSISVVYRGCGIPVAWTILPAGEPGEWRAHWERMLRKLSGVLGTEWKVVAMADRGLYAPWLYRAIQANGWHPRFARQGEFGVSGRGRSRFSPRGKPSAAARTPLAGAGRVE